MRGCAVKVAWCALVLQACAIHPTYVLDLADADTDEDVVEAAKEAREFLVEEFRPQPVREAAALTLGRLRRADPEVIAALGGVLASAAEDVRLRAFAAWALGEMRTDASLAALVNALRAPIGAPAGQYLLEAIAKHDALLAREQDR